MKLHPITFCLAILCSVSLLRAQAPAPDGPALPGRPPMRRVPPVIAALDTDKNGILSAEEIANAAKSLAALDKNSDGQLTLEELRPEPPRGDGPRGEWPGGDRPGPRDRGPRPDGLDGPPNGPNPPRGERPALPTPDAPQPSRPPSRDARPAGPGGPGAPGGPGGGDRPQRPMVPPVVAAIDADHNGSISAEELAGASKALAVLDKNNDGQLSREELMPGWVGDLGPRGPGHRPGERGRGPDAPDGGGPRPPRDQ